MMNLYKVRKGQPFPRLIIVTKLPYEDIGIEVNRRGTSRWC